MYNVLFFCKKSIVFVILILLVAATGDLFAGHVLAGEVTYQKVGPQQYEVFLHQHRECDAQLLPDSVAVRLSSADCGLSSYVYLKLNDGLSGRMTTPICNTAITNAACNGGAIPSERIYVYSDTITLSDCSDWTIGFTYEKRLSSVANIMNPTMDSLYFYTQFSTMPNAYVDYSGIRITPINYLCEGEPATLNMTVATMGNERVEYELIDPMTSAFTTVLFRSGLSAQKFLSGNSTISLDKTDGILALEPAILSVPQVAVYALRVRRWIGGVMISEAVSEHFLNVSNMCSYEGIRQDTFYVENAGWSLTNAGDAMTFCTLDSATFVWQFTQPAGDPIELDTNATRFDSIFGVANYTVTATGNTQGSTLELKLKVHQFPSKFKMNGGFRVVSRGCSFAYPILNRKEVSFSLTKAAWSPTADTLVCLDKRSLLPVFTPNGLNQSDMIWRLLSTDDTLQLQEDSLHWSLLLPQGLSGGVMSLEATYDGICVIKDSIEVMFADTAALSWRWIFDNTEPDSILLDVTSGGPVQYLWSTGDTVPNIKVPGKGIYSCTVTTESGCVSQLIAASSSSVQMLEPFAVALNPNPVISGNALHVALPDVLRGGHLTLSDLNGRKLFVKSLEPVSDTWTYIPERTGQYILQIKNGAVVWSQLIFVID